ncbi:ATP-binding protein [Pontibacter harenae]|uniref:ATP-binding protein n=1 Tax=Pontibacter harenae TaxID=2894083 RepID=UPI001E6570A5|nr:ATP-binding protein [Pontibacter harenae]MCC9166624.1 PAS domain-containing protein [Pontibacter harenae]
MTLSNSAAVTNSSYANIFRGGGEMGELMRSYDWHNHPLGSPDNWPNTLQTNLRLMLNSGFPMFIWWSENLYMFHNDAYIPALGKKHPKALGASAREMWAEIWEQLGVVAEGILKEGNQFYADSLLILLDRKGFIEETYWTFSYSPIFNEAGKVEGVFCACNEVTNTVLSQRRLKTLKDVSEEMALIQTLEQACQATSTILDENSDDIPFNLIYLFDKEGKKAHLLGYSGNLAEDAVIHEIDLNQQVTDRLYHFKQVQQSKEVVVVDNLSEDYFKGINTPGAALPKQAAIHPIFRPGRNSIIGFFVAGISPRLEYNADYKSFHQLLSGQFATSITSVQAREELNRQEQFLRDVFQQAPVGITIVSGPNYVVDIANPGVCEIWGRKPEEVLGKPVLEALPEVNSQGIKELLDGVVSTGVPFVANELPITFERNGQMEQLYLNFVYHPVRNSLGMIIGVIAIAIDISEQVKARQEIEAMNKELLATNADLDNFVYSASHDLKAPISNIEGLMHELVAQLSADTLESEIVQQLINYIQSSIDRFKKAVSDLTQVAKIQREAGEDVTQIDLANVVEEVKLDFNSIIAETDAIVEHEVMAGSTIQFSAKNVRSIVYNLLSNALKYRAPDKKPHIKIATELTANYVVLSVADNGLGIDLSEERKMFSMFKRLHDHVEGTGIGLYIVKKIVENAGGKIEVESQVGVGSTFKIHFKR